MKKKQLRKRIAELEGSVDFLRHFRDEQNRLVKEQTILLSSYEHDFQVQKDEISKQGQYIDSLEEQVGRYMAEAQVFENENKDLKLQIEQCIKDKMDLSVKLSIAKEKENRMYSVDNAEIKRLRHVEVERDKLKKEMVGLNKIITEQDNDIDLLGATIQELEANKEKLESELKRFADAVTRLTKEKYTI